MNTQTPRHSLQRAVAFIMAAALSFSGCGGGGGGGGDGAGNGGGGGTGGSTGASTTVNIAANAGMVRTLAGGPLGAVDGVGTAASFVYPVGVTSDGVNLYEVSCTGNTVRKIVIATGVVSTLAGKAEVSGSADGTGAAARFGCPTGITTDNTNLYVTEFWNSTVRKIVIATGEVTTLAGSVGKQGYADGVGAAAQFSYPYAIATDGSHLYVTDTLSYTIRKIEIATGAVTTLAGTPGVSGSLDGTGSAALFNGSYGIASDGVNLYVTDAFSQTIRKVVIATGAVTTLAGSAGVLGVADGIGGSASFNHPFGIATDGSHVYVADSSNNTIRKIVIATGAVSTMAGSTMSVGGHDDGIGSVAKFNFPQGLVVAGAQLFVADSNNHTIRKVAIATGAVSTFAGSVNASNHDAIGTAATFLGPKGIASDGTHLFVTDADNHTVRKIVIATGAVTTLAGAIGTPGRTEGTGATATFDGPSAVASDGTHLYVVDKNNHTIRKIVIATGAVTTLAGTAGTKGSTDGIGTAAQFSFPEGIATDGVNLYVADGSNTIRKIVIATGAVSTLAGSASSYPGSADGTGSAASFNVPTGIATDGSNLFVTDTTNHAIRKIVIATGEVTTLAGTVGASGSADGTGAGASFNFPMGIGIQGTDLFVTDAGSNTLRRVMIASGKVVTLAGQAGATGANDGTGTSALFSYPSGIVAVDASLYVTDRFNHAIREIH